MGKEILEVIKGINLDILKNEILAVVGMSGAGKSTLLHILGALDRPTDGQVSIDGTDIFAMKEQPLAHFRNQQIGFVFQFHHLLPEFTAVENVAMPGLIARAGKDKVMQRAADLLKEVGLEKRLHHKPRELSGGELQRIAFARALVNNPVLVLADEPSGNLDLGNSVLLHGLMWDLVRKKNKTLVVVTHNKELAESADRVIELFDGRIKEKNGA